ncbi:MAG: hypothetical protein V8T87_05945 [Victivallales bacterium]
MKYTASARDSKKKQGFFTVKNLFAPCIKINAGGLKIAGAPETRLDSILFFCGFRNRARGAPHHILEKRAKKS